MHGAAAPRARLRTSELDYELPPECIATHPAEPRDAARLLVCKRSDPAFVEHRRVRDLPGYLHAGDLLVVNDTRVLPARFRGVRRDTGGHAEGLYLSRGAGGGVGVGGWRVLLKMRRQRAGVIVDLFDHDGRVSGVSLRLLERASAEAAEGDASWLVEVLVDDVPVAGAKAGVDPLERVGWTPLPPYILAARKAAHEERGDTVDRRDYQTVYAREEREGEGSVAAPTAGLHFTPGLLESLAAKGVERAAVTLHVGLGTFKPVETEFVDEHPMHAEWCHVPRVSMEAIAARRRGGRGEAGAGSHERVVAVGTTSLRTLESFESFESHCTPAEGLTRETRLLITPGHRFRHADALMTNFHLPRSTLIALVSAFLERPDHPGEGVTRLLALYREALQRGYRFYSFGDAMLVLP